MEHLTLDFGARVREARQALRFTERAFAELIGMRHQRLHEIEHGRATPSQLERKLIAAASHRPKLFEMDSPQRA